jgi:hypothetical protein
MAVANDIDNNNWSTDRVHKLLTKINNDGIIPKENPFYKRQLELMKTDINFGYTESEISDRIRCEDDIFYFAESYSKVNTDEGITYIKLRKYQKKVLYAFMKYRFNVFLASRQIGKCVSFDTTIKILKDGVEVEMPIFQLYFESIKNPTMLDRLTFWLFKKAN